MSLTNGKDNVLVKNSKNIGVQRMEERKNKVTMRKMGAFKAERLEKRAKVAGISNYFPMLGKTRTSGKISSLIERHLCL